MRNIKGSIVSIVSPMNKNGSLDFKSFKKLLNFHVKQKTDCLLIAGTTGECSTLHFEEKLDLIYESKRILKKKKPIILGSCSNNTKEIIKIVKKCGKKIKAILQTPPYYNCREKKNILNHFEKIYKETNIPIILYNVPNRVGYDLSLKTILKISKIRGVFGIKDSSGSIKKCTDILTRTKLKLYSGDDLTSFLTAILGSEGVISVTANIFPKIIRNIFKFKKKKSFHSIIKTYKKMFNFNNLLFSEPNPTPIKWIMYKKKMIKKYVRNPLCEFEKKNNLYNEFEKIRNDKWLQKKLKKKL